MATTKTQIKDIKTGDQIKVKEQETGTSTRPLVPAHTKSAMVVTVTEVTIDGRYAFLTLSNGRQMMMGAGSKVTKA